MTYANNGIVDARTSRVFAQFHDFGDVTGAELDGSSAYRGVRDKERQFVLSDHCLYLPHDRSLAVGNLKEVSEGAQKHPDSKIRVLPNRVIGLTLA